MFMGIKRCVVVQLGDRRAFENIDPEKGGAFEINYSKKGAVFEKNILKKSVFSRSAME